MRIALAQINFILGGLQGNSRRIAACIALLTLFCCGCSPRPQNIWDSNIKELGGSYTHENRYTTYDKYTDYAIAIYYIDETYDQRRDLEHFDDAVRLCRATFETAWRNGAMTRYVTYHVTAVPFAPRFVVIAIKNYQDHHDASDFAASYRVAWLIPAADLFDASKSAQELSRLSLVDRHPFAFDVPAQPELGWSPEERYHWLIIERHMAAATQPDKADK